VDEHRILQALSNLAGNAVQHGTPGTPVQVRMTGNEEQVVVEVRNGGTIPSDMLPRLFEPFRSGGQYTRRGGGLGLGLFIARAIARAHGGGLDVSSSGGATTFRLVLPRDPAGVAAHT
jgi:signal transduction histidine kinase